jgi:hypothetical protein
MGVSDKKVLNQAKIAKECIRLNIGTTATAQTAKRTDAAVPGYAFEVVKVEFYCLTRPNAGFSADVQIGTTSVLSAAIADPTADAVTAGTLSSTLANRRGLSTDTLSLKYTTDADGAATNGVMSVWIRPLGLNGDGST